MDLRLLSFELGQQQFAVEISYVREVLVLSNLTPVPGAATCVWGLTNVRGTFAPVVDLVGLLGRAGVPPKTGDPMLFLEASPQPWSVGQKVQLVLSALHPTNRNVSGAVLRPSSLALAWQRGDIEIGPGLSATLLDVERLMREVRDRSFHTTLPELR